MRLDNTHQYKKCFSVIFSCRYELPFLGSTHEVGCNWVHSPGVEYGEPCVVQNRATINYNLRTSEVYIARQNIEFSKYKNVCTNKARREIEQSLCHRFLYLYFFLTTLRIRVHTRLSNH